MSRSCATKWNLNNTLSWKMRYTPDTIAGFGVATVVDVTCVPGYSKASFCHNTTCSPLHSLPTSSDAFCVCAEG